MNAFQVKNFADEVAAALEGDIVHRPRFFASNKCALLQYAGPGTAQIRSEVVLFYAGIVMLPEEIFMPARLPADVIRLIEGRNFAHLATLLADGSPHSAPVWIGREGDCLFIATDDNSVKGRNTRRDPRVAISLIDLVDPYSEAQIRGRVIERRRDSDFKYIDAVSMKYVGTPWPYREDVPVALIIEPDHVHYSKQPFEHEKAA